MDFMGLFTVASTVVAIIMTGLVLRITWAERQRSAARVAALAADIHAADNHPSGPVLFEPAPHLAFADHSLRSDEPAIWEREIFCTEQRSSRQWLFGLGALALGAVAAIGLVLALSTGDNAGQQTPAQRAFAAMEPRPLELLALDHERIDDHLTVRGVIRNPLHAPELDHLTAVILLFNQQGGFLTSGRAAVQASQLGPGAEASFVVTLPGGADVGRYRVSFRTDDQIVPHVDRRQSVALEKHEAKS